VPRASYETETRDKKQWQKMRCDVRCRYGGGPRPLAMRATAGREKKRVKSEARDLLRWCNMPRQGQHEKKPTEEFRSMVVLLLPRYRTLQRANCRRQIGILKKRQNNETTSRAACQSALKRKGDATLSRGELRQAKVDRPFAHAVATFLMRGTHNVSDAGLRCRGFGQPIFGAR
jgi:hypothetical protein